jgi:hypothetical protein
MQRLAITSHGELWIEPDPEGEFVRADEAMEKIESLRQDIDLLQDALQSVVKNELPPGEPDPINPGEFVDLCLSHMDHEAYRESVRVAAALIGMKRMFE